LIDKRREVAGKIELTQRELHNLVIMLDHLDFTIRMFAPDADLGNPKRFPVAHQAFVSFATGPPKIGDSRDPGTGRGSQVRESMAALGRFKPFGGGPGLNVASGWIPVIR
jgi:hypothetical protein